MQVSKEEFNRRSSCSITCSLDIVGDKWTLVIIRDALYSGAKSFGDFSKSSEKIASNILTNRLERMVAYGIFSKTQNADNKLKFDYNLTERGRELEPILWALGKWGHRHIEATDNMKDFIKAV